MKKSIYFVLLIAAITTALLVSSPQKVGAFGPPPPPSSPAAGDWIWDNEDVIGTTIPQYQLAPTSDDDYSLLQSSGIHLSGATRLCHPYRGGQYGWNAEIRVLTNTGWQPVPTLNEWVPDEEGKFMTCAQANYSGTYAVFGYWVRPEGWKQCPVPGFSIYIGPVVELPIFIFTGETHAVTGCGPDGSIGFDPPLTDPFIMDFFSTLFYCCNGGLYFADSPVFVGPEQQ